jgi:NAD-dependent dihydropyrimidine dehydrogenase PreA subunit
MVSDNELFMPIIDAARCGGCATCVEVCPTSALVLRSERAVLAYPKRCIYCADCEEHCPQGAISLPYEIVYEPGSDAAEYGQAG